MSRSATPDQASCSASLRRWPGRARSPPRPCSTRLRPYPPNSSPLNRLLGKHTSVAGRVEQRLQLRKNEASQLCASLEPVAIRVGSGLVVVTREGDPEDHVLRAGETVVLSLCGTAAAWALEPARATVPAAR